MVKDDVQVGLSKTTRLGQLNALSSLLLVLLVFVVIVNPKSV